MITSNPGKFHIIPNSKIKQDHTNGISKISFKEIKIAFSVKLFEVKINNKLNFESRKNRIRKSAANQLNAMFTIKRFVSLEVHVIIL